MKVKELLVKLEEKYNCNLYNNISELVTMYRLQEKTLRYDEKFLKNVKKYAENLGYLIDLTKYLTTKRLRKYIDFEIKETGEETTQFVFYKNAGLVLLKINNNTLNEIKDILIAQGYTDEKGFNFLMKKDPLSLISLFIRETEESVRLRLNRLNEMLKKKDIENIEYLFQRIDGDKHNEKDIMEEDAEKIMEDFFNFILKTGSEQILKGDKNV